MNLPKEQSGIVIAGNWNFSIFNPEWVGKYLLPGEKLEVEIPINHIGSIKVRTSELSIAALDGRLMIMAIVPTDEVFSKIASIVVKLSDYLPHTPVIGLGINYVFEFDATEKITQVFQVSDSSNYENESYELLNTEIVREFKKKTKDDVDYILRVDFRKDQVGIKALFNHHFNINSLTVIKEFMSEEKMIDYKNNCIEIIGNYDIQ